jgi:hypothetical protein
MYPIEKMRKQMNFDPKSLAGRQPTKNAGDFDPTKWSFVTLFKLLFIFMDGGMTFTGKKKDTYLEWDTFI